MAARLVRLVVRDILAAGALIAVAMLVWPGEGQAFAFAAGSIWAALNFYLLALLVVSLSSQNRPGRLFIFVLACAKIPAS